MLRYQFNGLPRNTRIILLSLPLWSAAFYAFSSYASLYMLDLGLSASQIGIISSTGTLVQILLAPLAGPLVDRLGRKRTGVIFDHFAWIAATIIWALATEFWHFMAAAILNSMWVFTSLAFNLFLIEDLRSDQRVFSFRVVEIIGILLTFLTPITGLLIRQFGVVPAMRGVYWYAAACYTGFLVVKALFLSETTTGKKLKESGEPREPVLRGFAKAAVYTFRHPALMAAMVANIAFQFTFLLTNLYLFPMLTRRLGINAGILAAIPFLTAVVALVAVLFVQTSLANASRMLITGWLSFVLGGIILLVVTPGMAQAWLLALLAVNTALWAVGRSLVRPLLQTAIANLVDDPIRSRFMSFNSFFNFICLLPAGLLGGWLFDQSPVFPFFLVLGLAVLGLALQMGVSRWMKTGQVET